MSSSSGPCSARPVSSCGVAAAAVAAHGLCRAHAPSQLHPLLCHHSDCFIAPSLLTASGLYTHSDNTLEAAAHQQGSDPAVVHARVGDSPHALPPSVLRRPPIITCVPPSVSLPCRRFRPLPARLARRERAQVEVLLVGPAGLTTSSSTAPLLPLLSGLRGWGGPDGRLVGDLGGWAASRSHGRELVAVGKGAQFPPALPGAAGGSRRLIQPLPTYLSGKRSPVSLLQARADP